MHKKHQPIADFYNNHYYAGQKSGPPDKHLYRLSSRLHVTQGQRVLDIACGTGEWLQVCSERGAEVFGVDISSKAIDLCELVMPHGDFRCQPAEILPYENQSFDLVTCLGSLEHFLDQENAINEMARVAKNNAKIVILVPNSGFFTYRLGLFSGTQQKTVKETIRSLKEWETMINDNGLIIEKRWRDLHILSMRWIYRKPFYLIPARVLQAIALPFWPLAWQYQVFHLCSRR